MMRRTTLCLTLALLATSCLASAPVYADAAWEACLATPKRGCVFDEALYVAQTLKDEVIRAMALADVAAAQSKAGLAKEAAANIAPAMQALQSVDDKRRDWLLARIVRAQTSAGEFREGLATAQSVKDTQQRVVALGGIAAAQQGAGLTQEAAATFEQAIGAAQSLAEDPLVFALLYVAEAQMNAKLKMPAAVTLDLAVQAAQTRKQHGMLLFVAQAQAKAGEFAEATEVARSDEDTFSSLGLLAVVVAEAQGGKLAEATELAPLIPYPPAHISALAAVAVAQVKAGFAMEGAGLLVEARRLAQSLPSGAGSARALADVAGALAAAGYGKESTTLFGQAIQAAQSLADVFQRDEVLKNIAALLAKSSKAAEAIGLAQSIKDQFPRSVALDAIADVQEQAGKWSDALRTTQAMDDALRRVDRLAEIAPKLPN